MSDGYRKEMSDDYWKKENDRGVKLSSNNRIQQFYPLSLAIDVEIDQQSIH